MIEMKSGTAYEPVQSEHVKLVEQSTNVLFPESYLRFMDMCNGGVPVRRNLNLGERAITIQRFFHIVSDYKTNHEMGMYDIGVVHSKVFYLVGESTAPIAALSGGDLLCLGSDGSHEARVNIWDSLLSEEDAPVHHHVADTFDEFVEIYQQHSST